MSKYAIYTGNTINTVSVWVRRGEKEYPIYANTRGRCEWYTFDTSEYENTEPTELSSEMLEWLAHFHRVREGLIDTHGLPAKAIEDDKPDVDPEWYEVEILNSIGDPEFTAEQVELLEWAYNQVEANE